MIKERAMGDNILFLMQENGTSLSDMAEKIGISSDDLKRLTESRKTVPISVLKSIADFFGVDPIGLFELDNSRKHYCGLECMEGFSRPDSADKILDIIDTYCNIKDSLKD